jgi:hypothetical protein
VSKVVLSPNASLMCWKIVLDFLSLMENRRHIFISILNYRDHCPELIAS